MIFLNDSFKIVPLKEPKKAGLLRAVHVLGNGCLGNDRLEMLWPLALLAIGMTVTVVPHSLPSSVQIGKVRCHFYTFAVLFRPCTPIVSPAHRSS